MSLGPVMLDLEGTTLQSHEKELLSHPAVGGVILFSRNYESPDQLTRLVSDIHLQSPSRLLVAVDHEGGRVQRFRHEFTNLPAVSRLGEIYDEDPKQAKHLAEVSGWIMAIELRSVGVDFSFAPVLDLQRSISSVIGDRAFHRKPEVVAELAHAYMAGMHKAGMESVGKHFPGHGSVSGDSHHVLPVDSRRLEDIMAADVVAFERMVHFGIAAIMPAHVVYDQIDPLPACFSPFWLKEVLRGQLEFKGAIVSDDLSMEGAVGIGDYGDRAMAALEAGCDLILVCNNRKGAETVLDRLSDYRDPISHSRLIRLHGRHSPTRMQLQKHRDWQRAVAMVQSYDVEPMLDMDD